MTQKDLELANLLRDSVEEFLGNQAPKKDFPPVADRATWQALAELGWPALTLPESLGGSGLGFAEAAIVAEALGRHAVIQHYVACATMPSVILVAATASPATTDLAQLLQSGEKLLTLAWQEETGQLDAVSPATRLVDGSLHGRKIFVPAADSDSILLVLADRGGVPVLVGVDASSANVAIESVPTGLGGFGHVTFTGAPVQGQVPLLEGAGAIQAVVAAIDAARALLAAQLHGVANGCLSKTLEYVADRKQFGRAIGSFQSIRHRCVDLRIGCALAGATWHDAVVALDSGRSDASLAAAAAKARCADVALDVGRASVQMHGAMGYTEEGGVGRYLRTAMAGGAWLGSSTAHRRRLLLAGGSSSHV